MFSEDKTHKAICVQWVSTYMVTQHLPHITLFHNIPTPVTLQHCVFHNDRNSSEDEGQEEVGVYVVSSAPQFPLREK